MYNEIRTYFNAVITTVNGQISGTLNDLKEVDTLLDINLVPANLKNNCYQIKIENIEEDQRESRKYDIFSVKIELWFLIGKDRNNYEYALDKLRLIKNYLKKASMTEGTYFSIRDNKDIKLSNLNNIIADNYLRCDVQFDLLCSDIK